MAYLIFAFFLNIQKIENNKYKRHGGMSLANHKEPDNMALNHKVEEKEEERYFGFTYNRRRAGGTRNMQVFLPGSIMKLRTRKKTHTEEHWKGLRNFKPALRYRQESVQNSRSLGTSILKETGQAHTKGGTKASAENPNSKEASDDTNPLIKLTLSRLRSGHQTHEHLPEQFDLVVEKSEDQEILSRKSVSSKERPDELNEKEGLSEIQERPELARGHSRFNVSSRKHTIMSIEVQRDTPDLRDPLKHSLKQSSFKPHFAFRQPQALAKNLDYQKLLGRKSRIGELSAPALKLAARKSLCNPFAPNNHIASSKKQQLNRTAFKPDDSREVGRQSQELRKVPSERNCLRVFSQESFAPYLEEKFLRETQLDPQFEGFLANAAPSLKEPQASRAVLRKATNALFRIRSPSDQPEAAPGRVKEEQQSKPLSRWGPSSARVTSRSSEKLYKADVANYGEVLKSKSITKILLNK